VNLLVTKVTLNGEWEVKPACREDLWGGLGWGWGEEEELDDMVTADVECYEDRQKGRDYKVVRYFTIPLEDEIRLSNIPKVSFYHQESTHHHNYQ